jgi:hypothetical protein
MYLHLISEKQDASTVQANSCDRRNTAVGVTARLWGTLLGKLALLRIVLLEACDIIGIYARPKARRLGGGATLDYNRNQSAPDSRCIYASLGMHDYLNGKIQGSIPRGIIY